MKVSEDIESLIEDGFTPEEAMLMENAHAGLPTAVHARKNYFINDPSNTQMYRDLITNANRVIDEAAQQLPEDLRARIIKISQQ